MTNGGVGSRTTIGSVVAIVGASVGDNVGGLVNSSTDWMEAMYPLFWRYGVNSGVSLRLLKKGVWLSISAFNIKSLVIK